MLHKILEVFLKDTAIERNPSPSKNQTLKLRSYRVYISPKK